MKILIAANSFKNSLSAANACYAIKEGLIKKYPSFEYELCPIGDGGDSTCEVLSQALYANIVEVETTGPLFEKIISHYGYHKKKKIAIIETASAAGISLLKKKST